MHVRRAAAEIRFEAEQVGIRFVVEPRALLVGHQHLIGLLEVLMAHEVLSDRGRQRVVGTLFHQIAHIGLAENLDHRLEAEHLLDHGAQLRALGGIVAGQMLVPVIDDAHLMPADCLRKLRLLCEDFPRSHNLVLIGQPPLLQSLTLTVNEEIRSRVTYSVVLPRLSPETIEAFILAQLDRAGLGHNTFTPDALALIVRSGEGVLRRTRGLTQQQVAGVLGMTQPEVSKLERRGDVRVSTLRAYVVALGGRLVVSARLADGDEPIL